MKIDRLIGILSILLQKQKVTAPYLAEKFEVSRRTINRDVENLCMAGIPIVTEQGAGGGISLMEGYGLDKTLLTSSDMQAILAGLRSLDSVSGTNRYQQLMEKLAVGKSSVLSSNDHILIDLSSWYKETLAPKIELIQAAIGRKSCIYFRYFAPSGESLRTVEPYCLLFQWSSWYLWAYCLERQDFRMFKLNRMQELRDTGEIYEERERGELSIEPERIFPLTLEAEVRFEPEVKWRLVEEYGMECFEEASDGTLIFKNGFADKASLFGWVLSFGASAELVKPEELRQEFEAILANMMGKYENTQVGIAKKCPDFFD